MNSSSRGERWFGRLVGLTAVVGTVWLYFGFAFGSYLGVAFVVLVSLLAAVIWVVHRRDLERGFAERARRLEHEVRRTTLPGDRTDDDEERRHRQA